MKKLLLFIIIISLDVPAQQYLTLQECFDRSRENYPLIKQKEYIEKTRDYSVSNVWKAYFPQITINAQANYQSDVTSIPINFPGIKVDKLSLDQYKIYADVSQILYDGGTISTQSKIQESLNDIDEEKLEVDLLKIKERVNQIYFAILLLDTQLAQIKLVIKDLQGTTSKLEAAYKNGTATKTDLETLRAEILKSKQRKIDLHFSRSSYIKALSFFINQEIDDSIILKVPEEFEIGNDFKLNRPELNLFSAQQNLSERQLDLVDSKIIPKLSLFFQGGYGKPALNMLKNNFEWYYITGIKLSLPIFSLYTYQNEKDILELTKLNIESQRDAFLLNTKIIIAQQFEEIKKLKELIELDKNIVELRKSIRESAQSKLENGIITSNDYLHELYAEDTAIQNLELHKIQLLLTQYNLRITTGN